MGLEGKINDWLEDKFLEEDYSDCYIVELEISGNKIEVFMDCESGLSLGKCQKLSRYLEGFLDEDSNVPEKYTLDVSSPGLSRPLKLKRQYIKNIGRKLKIITIANEMIEGELTAVEEDYIVVIEKVRVKEGRVKVRKTITNEIKFDEIKKALIKISFK